VLVPPVVRGGLATRSVSLVLGLFACSLGVVLLLESELGLAPWDVLHQGIADHTPLSFGTTSIAVGLIVLVIAWRLGARIGPGTIANAILIGAFIDLLLRIEAVADLDESSLATRIGLLVAGLASFGLGSAFYIGADLGAGPRDSLMLVLARRRGVRIGVVRALLEIAVTVLGFALGGTIGIGTLAFAFGIGPIVEFSFWLLERSPLADPSPQPLPGPAATVAE
jgi:uncharacterized membrane protein YczE